MEARIPEYDLGIINKEKVILNAECVCNLLNHRAKDFWGNTVKALAVGNNTYATHLYGARREENTLVLRGKEALRTGFAAEKDDGVEFRR